MPTRAPARKLISASDLIPKLARMEKSFVARWLLLIIAGSLFCLIGPFLFGSLIWMRRVGRTDQSWLSHVGMTAAWFLPILFLIEWATRGKMLEEGAEAMGSTMRLPGVRSAAQGMVMVEMCLWGPRMVIAGTKKLYNLGEHRRADRALAAEILAALVNRGEGTPTGQLYPLAKGDDDAFGTTLGYLLFHDLIGISKAGDRAWLLSEAKRTLRLD